MLILMTTAAAASMILFGIIGLKADKTVAKAAYGSKSEIKYNLNFSDDPFYNQDNIEFGNGYVTKLVSNIDLTLLYNFSCAEATEFRGSHSASAILEATYNETDIIWKKEFQLIPHTDFKTKQVTEYVSLPIMEYVELSKNLQEATGVLASVTMTVTYTANASALIDGEPISDSSQSTLVFPVTGDVMVMGGTPLSEQSKNVEAEVPQELLPKREMLIGSIILLSLFVTALLLLLLLTIGVKEDPLELQLNKILKKYGSRIIELNSGARMDEGETICVKSFSNLLLTADELRKPIFKTIGKNLIDTEFFVLDEPVKYVFEAGCSKEGLEDTAECLS